MQLKGVLFATCLLLVSGAHTQAKEGNSLKCAEFEERFKTAAKFFNAKREEMVTAPQRYSTLGRQIINWPELQAAYDCDNGMFSGVSVSLLDADADGRTVLSRFFRAALLAAIPRADPKHIDEFLTRIERDAGTSDAGAEEKIDAYVVLFRGNRFTRFSIESPTEE